MPTNDTENYILARMRTPSLFEQDSFRQKWLNETQGIAAVFGKLKTDALKVIIQSMRFSKDAGWTVSKVKTWMTSHKGKLSNIEVIDMAELGKVELKPWDTKYINDLPDAAFAVIASGGETADGKTAPRSLRKLPHHGPSVKNGMEKVSLDLPHLRNALARANQITGVSAEEKAAAKKHLLHHAVQVGMGQDMSSNGVKRVTFDEVRGLIEEEEVETIVNEEKGTAAPQPTETITHALSLRIIADTLGFKPVDRAEKGTVEDKNQRYAVFCHEDETGKHSDLYLQDCDATVRFVLREDNSATYEGVASLEWLDQDSTVVSTNGKKVKLSLRGRGRYSRGLDGELFMEGYPYNGHYSTSDGKLTLIADDTPTLFTKVLADESVPSCIAGLSHLPPALKEKLPKEMRYWEGAPSTVKLVKAALWYKEEGWKPKMDSKMVRLSVTKTDKILSSIGKPVLRISGVAINEGTYNEIFWPAEELEKAAPLFKGKPVMLDHRYEAAEIVGQITDSKYNAAIKSIEYVAEIDDESVAIPISRGTLNNVSIGTYLSFGMKWKDPDGEHNVKADSQHEILDALDAAIEKHGVGNVTGAQLYARDLEPRELSIVMEGACSPADGCSVRKVEIIA